MRSGAFAVLFSFPGFSFKLVHTVWWVITPVTFFDGIGKNSAGIQVNEEGLICCVLFRFMGSDKQSKRAGGAAYVRLRGGDRKWSFAQQRDVIRRYAARRGLRIVAEYADGDPSREGGS